jgi:hypothetical protein
MASALFGLLDFLQGFVIASPLLIYLRMLYENTDSSLRLWPLPSADVVSDFMINHNEIFIFYIITAAVLYFLFFFLKTFFAGGIYRLIIFDKDDPSAIKTVSDFLKSSSQIWTGFLKTGLFAVLIYGLALFLGLVFGDFLGRFWSFLKLALPGLFLFLGSTYLQILKIHIASSSDNSLKTALRETRERISGVLLRIIILVYSQGDKKLRLEFSFDDLNYNNSADHGVYDLFGAIVKDKFQLFSNQERRVKCSGRR